MVKQVIVVRKDLKMRRGKEIAQGAHASMAWLTTRIKMYWHDNAEVKTMLGEKEKEWVNGVFTKVCLQVDSEAALREVYEKALSAGLESHLIIDHGLTEFNGIRTPTCVGIGPDYADKIDAVTGHLKLY